MDQAAAPNCLTGRKKALLFWRKNDYFGDAFGHASAAYGRQLRRPQKKRGNKKISYIFLYCGFFYCGDH